MPSTKPKKCFRINNKIVQHIMNPLKGRYYNKYIYIHLAWETEI